MDTALLASILCILIFLVFWCLGACTRYKWNKRRSAQQSSSVWSISGQMNQDGSISDNSRWPTHDHRVSVDSFAVSDNLRIPQKNRAPPPAYCEVDLPSYEQAISMSTSVPKNDIPIVHVTPSTSRNYERPD